MIQNIPNYPQAFLNFHDIQAERTKDTLIQAKQQRAQENAKQEQLTNANFNINLQQMRALNVYA